MIILEKLEQIVKESEIKSNEPLKKYSFTKTGGNAEKLILVKSEEDLSNIIKYSLTYGVKLTVLGNGSNVLISDKGIKGVTIITSGMNNISRNGNEVICEAGATLKELADFCIREELSGLEFSCGIPGSIGGAIFMNAGAYGGEVKDVVTRVETIDEKGEKKVYSNADMKFSYRHSIIQESKEIITKVYFKLQKGNRKNIVSRVDELNKLRADKQPLEYPSCGSVFKRPEGHFAGKLIQDAGCQGLTVGGAQVSTKHAGFMVNINAATCEDYKSLIKQVQEKVYNQFGVELEREVKIIGEE